MKAMIFALSAVAAVATLSAPAYAGGGLYPTEEGAQSTCPSQEVVWLQLQSSKYFHKTSAVYGGKNGAYACVAKARSAGYREAKVEAAPETASAQ
jgi:hypothetical protein